MKKIDGTNVCLIITFATIVILAVVDHIFYYIKGGYPVELSLAIITTCLTEIVALITNKLNKRKYKADTEKSDKA